MSFVCAVVLCQYLFLDRDLDAYLQLAGVIVEATLFCLVKFSLMFVSLGIWLRVARNRYLLGCPHGPGLRFNI